MRLASIPFLLVGFVYLGVCLYGAWQQGLGLRVLFLACFAAALLYTGGCLATRRESSRIWAMVSAIILAAACASILGIILVPDRGRIHPMMLPTIAMVALTGLAFALSALRLWQVGRKRG